MVDSGTGRDQVVDRSLSFDRQQTADIVDAQIRHRGVQIDHAALDPVPVQHRQDALAHRCEVRQLFDVAEGEDDAALVRDDHAGRVGAVSQERGSARERLAIPAVLRELGPAQHLPLLAREHAVVALGSEGRGSGARERREEDQASDSERHWTTSPATPSWPSRKASSIAEFRTFLLNVRPPACPARGS